MAEIKYAQDERLVITPDQAAQWTVDATQGLLATGPCAKCKHEFSVPVRSDVITSTAAVAASVPPEKRTTRRVACGCSVSHPGRPATVLAGCGRWWLATVVQETDGSYKMIAPPDEGIAGAATALDAAQRDEVTAVRTWGEKWLPAVAALYGLFGLAGLVLAKDTIAGLPVPGRVVMFIPIAAGLAATALAVWWGYRAAFGWMTLQTVDNDVELIEWYEQRRAALAKAPPLLKKALEAAFASLVALFLAVAVLWFWPSDPASPTVLVAYNEGGDAGAPTTACGILVTSKDGMLTVKAVDGGVTRPIPIKAADVTSLTVKDKC